MCGLRAICVALANRGDGMPRGVQFVGGPRADWALLQLAGQVERAAPWHDRVPPMALEGTEHEGMVSA